jgi:hypothetical protein
MNDEGGQRFGRRERRRQCKRYRDPEAQEVKSESAPETPDIQFDE